METKPRPCRGFFFPALPRRGAVFFRSVLLRRLRRGPPRSREALGWSSAPEGAAVLPHWGSSLTSASCLSSRARHIHVPLDPQCGRTASSGAFGAALRSLGGLAWQSAGRSDAAFTEDGKAQVTRWFDRSGTASRLPGFHERSHDLQVRRGRRALGICPKWHMDVPRPFVKTGCRPKGGTYPQGTAAPTGADASSAGTAPPQGASASTGHGGPERCPRPRLFSASAAAPFR